MKDLPSLTSKNFPSVHEYHDVTREQFWNDIYPLGEPAILRGHCADWAAVQMGEASNKEFATYLHNAGPNGEVNAFVGQNNDGRFFYNEDLSGFNFDRAKVKFSAFLTKLLHIDRDDDPTRIYVGATAMQELLPSLYGGNQSTFPPEGTPPLIWIGNSARVAPHMDTSDNIAPASLVDPRNVDDAAFPKYAQAEKAAKIAELQPGDAIFIPALHWHYVESDGPLDHYVFGDEAGESTAHIPDAVKGILAAPSQERDHKIKSFLQMILR